VSFQSTTQHTASIGRPANTTQDLRRATRILAALILPIGPAVIAILRYVMPYSTTDDAKTIVREVAADRTTQSAVVWLGFAGVLTLLPAIMWVGRLTRRTAPRLTAAAIVLLVPGYTALAFLVSSDAAVLFAVRHHLDVKTAADAYTNLHPIMLVAGAVFVVGHVIGTVRLGIAFLRTAASRAGPHWPPSPRNRCTSSPSSSSPTTPSTSSAGH
jgi:hypothetical protein